MQVSPETWTPRLRAIAAEQSSLAGGVQGLVVQTPPEVQVPVQLAWRVSVQHEPMQQEPLGGQGFGEQTVPSPWKTLVPVQPAARTWVQTPVALQQAPVVPQVVGLRAPAELTLAATGPELLRALKPLIEKSARPLAGDLMFFDGGEVVAIATTSLGDTTEFIYVRNGVIRRGVVTPSRPGRKRDDGGRALNTFVRPWAREDGTKQKYLAGEIFDGVLRLDQLVAGNRTGPTLH